jgi:hypothetical protein
LKKKYKIHEKLSLTLLVEFSSLKFKSGMGLLTTLFCMSFQIFNGCPLKINCTASWIHPETRDQHILVGAEEGIYTLNLTELHENAMDLLYPRRTVWMFVIKDVLMTLSGTYSA